MQLKNIHISLQRFHIEAFIWMAALISLAFLNPVAEQHYTLCLFSNLGFDFCPGCGIGHSISSILHGNFHESFQHHPLGLFAIGILLYRIFIIFRKNPLLINKTDHLKGQ